MEEKIIREKNRTSIKKISNDDDRLKEQKKMEVMDCGLSSVERATAGWSRGIYGVRAGLVACWEKIKRRKERLKEIKINFFTY